MAFGRRIAAFAKNEAGSGLVGRVCWCDLEAGRKHLFHEQAGGDSLQSIVDGFSHGGLCRIRFVDLIGETGAGLARCVSGGATNELHNLSPAGTIADREGVFSPNPVEAFLPLPKRDEEVTMVAVFLL